LHFRNQSVESVDLSERDRLNKKDEPVIREALRDKVERDINVSDEQAKRRRFRPRL
jgi:hypothetical protein